MQDPTLEIEKQKEALNRKTMLYEAALNDEFKELKEDVKSLGTKALLVGAGALAVYLIFKKLSGKKEEPGKIKKKTFYADPNTQLVVHQPKQESPIVRMIKEHIALFVIGIVKEKLAAFIREAELQYIAKANDARNNGHSSNNHK